MIKDNYGRLAAVGLLIALGWSAYGIWQAGIERVKSGIDEKRLEDKKEIDRLKAEVGRLQKYLVHNQEIELDQFNWTCSERKGILDLNHKTCTYTDRQVIRRFEYLDPADQIEVPTPSPPSSP
jgi:hypothetical protein